jgi:GT2 family glycosyltransferase
MTKNVFIIVLNWNGGNDTLACLNSLQELHYQDCRLVVVDNGSTDGSLERIRATIWARTVTILENGTNLGYAVGNNVGIRYALEHDADFILLLNNDTVVDPQLIDALVHAAERYPDDGIFGATIFYLELPDTVWFQGAKWSPDLLDFTCPPGSSPGVSAQADEETDYVCGAAMFFRAEIARRIGARRALLSCVRGVGLVFQGAVRAYGCRVVSAAKVWHKIAPFGTETSPLRAYLAVEQTSLGGKESVMALTGTSVEENPYIS